MWRIVLSIALAPAPLTTQIDHGPPASPIAGILEVPGIFGEYPCTRYTPESLEVREGSLPESPVVGMLQVVRQWYAPGSDTCEMIQVGVQTPETATHLPAAIREFGYEQPGLVVLEFEGSAFRIALGNTSGWIRPDDSTFHSYPQLVRESLAYVPAGWNGELWSAPGEGPKAVPGAWLPYLGESLTVEIVDDQIVDSGLWLKLRFGPNTGCGELEAGLPVVEGWIPAYTSDGSNAVWFNSRGC